MKPMTRDLTTFVLVHGASHGGWCWQRVVNRLTAKGHRVFAPTLTGLCERSHILNDKIDLTTHIGDIVNEIKWKDLDQIVLVGHSYGGMVNLSVPGWTPPPPPFSGANFAAFMEVNDNDRAWVASKLTPQPQDTLTEKLRVSGAFLTVPRKSFVGVTKGEQPFFKAVADRYAADPAWQVHQLDCGHDVMIDKPDELTAILEGSI